MNILSIQYIEKALEIAERDKEKIQKKLDEYLHVDTGSKESIDRYFELRDGGYDLCAESSKIVDIEIAIQNLHNHIFLLKRNLNRHEKTI